MKRLGIIILLFISASLEAQSFSEAYETAYQYFMAQENYAYQIRMKSSALGVVVSDYQMQMEKIGDHIYSKVEQTESYSLDSTSIIIDHESESILLNEKLDLLKKDQFINNLSLIKDLEKKAVASKMEKKGELTRHTLVFRENEFLEISIDVDTEKGLFHGIAFKPNLDLIVLEEERKVDTYEIIIEEYNTDISAFSQPISTFMDYREGKYEPNSKYSTYQFINNYGY